MGNKAQWGNRVSQGIVVLVHKIQYRHHYQIEGSSSLIIPQVAKCINQFPGVKETAVQ